MASDQPQPKSPAVTPAAAESEPVARRAYVAPQLRHLGSVRDLTLGVGGSIFEFASMMTM